MPLYFYPLFLILKTSLPVLVALVVGLVETWKRRREPGPFFLIVMFLFWIIPFSLVSAKWLRWMLSWMPTLYIMAALGVVRIFAWASGPVSETRRRLVPALAAAVALVFLVEPAWVSARNAPYYTLYLSPRELGRTAYYVPHDEMNDMGLREAIAPISGEAPQGAGVGGATAPVFAYYFHKFGRDDLHYFDLSRWQSDVGPTLASEAAGASPGPTNAYVVIQDGRKYFENINFIQQVESSELPVQTVEIRGAAAVRIYRVPGTWSGDKEFAELRKNR